MTEPFFQPFEGGNYRSQNKFPGRLLIVGESCYLTEKDKHPGFTNNLMNDVIRCGLTSHSKTRYYRNLFHVLKDKPAREATQEEWEGLWSAIAFYIFVQSTEITRPLQRPTRQEWEEAKAPFLNVLARLKPDFVLLTGSQLWGHATAIKIADKPNGRPGVLLPTGNDNSAYARGMFHPSSRQFAAKRAECRAVVEELLGPGSA